MAGVLEAVRESCPEGLWARGVTLARDGAVHGLSADADEIKLRVLIPGAPRTFGVSLFPKAAAWECDCDSPHDACAHAAAAVSPEVIKGVAEVAVGPVPTQWQSHQANGFGQGLQGLGQVANAQHLVAVGWQRRDGRPGARRAGLELII